MKANKIMENFVRYMRDIISLLVSIAVVVSFAAVIAAIMFLLVKIALFTVEYAP